MIAPPAFTALADIASVPGTFLRVQATATGLAMGFGGIARDVVGDVAKAGYLGPALTDANVGYAAVYLIEVVLLFAALAAIGPLFKRSLAGEAAERRKFGLSELPG